jgi:hypothetical protein
LLTAESRLPGCAGRRVGGAWRPLLPARRPSAGVGAGKRSSRNRADVLEDEEPSVSYSGATYTGADRLVAHQRRYHWNHAVGETALLLHGLRLERVGEHDWATWRRLQWLVHTPAGTWAPQSRSRARRCPSPCLPLAQRHYRAGRLQLGLREG